MVGKRSKSIGVVEIPGFRALTLVHSGRVFFFFTVSSARGSTQRSDGSARAKTNSRINNVIYGCMGDERG